jgi:hypothetical protein
MSCGRGGGEHKCTESFDGETCGKELEDLRHTCKDNTKMDKYILKGIVLDSSAFR